MVLFHAKNLFSIFLFLLLFLISPHSVSAESTNVCHCFQNRAYNPADKFAADEYILATSFNSLIAKSFNISKRQVVFLKMKGGVDQNDLLIGLKTETAAGIDLDILLSKRKNGSSWARILNDPSLREKIKNDDLLQTIKSGHTAEEAGQKVADSIIADFYKIPMETVGKYRTSGLTEKEITLLFILSETKNKNTDELLEQYRNGKSWSEIADSLGIEPAAAGKLIVER